jgi:putative endonuclease
MEDLWIVYVLESEKNGKRYSGMTQDLERRLAEHNSGKSKFTSTLIPWKLVYKEEVLGTENARKREKYFKSGAGRKFIEKLVNSRNNN